MAHDTQAKSVIRMYENSWGMSKFISLPVPFAQESNKINLNKTAKSIIRGAAKIRL